MSRFNQLNQYESDDDSSLSDDSQTTKDTQTKKRKEKESVQWELAEKFDEPDDIEYDKCFSFLYANETQEGRKEYYRCNLVPRKGHQCPRRIFLWYHVDDETLSMFESYADHEHQNKKVGLSNEAKEKIKEIYKYQTKPSIIIQILEDNNIHYEN
jgi:hypothetical protein